MKTKLLICIWLITSHICTYSQITFKKTFGNTLDQYVGTVKQCLDGGYIIAGSSYFNYHGSTPLYNSSMYVIRTNEYGDTLWIRNFEITLPDKLVYSDVIQNPDGSFILCGSYGNIADHINLYLSKLDANGKTIWILSEGCKGSGNSFYKTFDEGFIVVGDYNLYRTDAVGKKIWCKHVGSGDPYLPLGYVLQSADSNFMATGSTNGYSIINLIKLNTEGNVIWLKHFDYMRPSGGHNLIESPNHEYYLLGSAKYFNKPDSTYHNNTYILKTNSNGDSLWAIEYPYLLKNTFLIQTKDGGYAFTGNTLPENEFYTLNSIYLVKSDANGKVQWTQTYT